ncbi:MAG: hypothetical protein AAFW66_08705, partial [Pseudomonadota bacterium]
MSKQTKALKDLLTEASKEISADITIRLWDGDEFAFHRSDAENVVISAEISFEASVSKSFKA